LKEVTVDGQEKQEKTVAKGSRWWCLGQRVGVIMVVVVVVVIVVGVKGVMMANLWRGCACTVPYCTQKAPMGEGHSTVTPKDEGAQRRVLHNRVRRTKRRKEKFAPPSPAHKSHRKTGQGPENITYCKLTNSQSPRKDPWGHWSSGVCVASRATVAMLANAQPQSNCIP